MSRTPTGRHDSFAVAQLGARMHYAVPRMLYGAGMLERLYTDLVAVKGWPGAARRLAAKGLGTGQLRRMVARVPDGAPPVLTTHWPGFALQYYWRRRRAKTQGELTATHLWAGREFCGRIIRHGFGHATAVYVFNSAGHELLQHAREKGLLCVMEQTSAPAEIENELLAAESRAFPDWEPSRGVDAHRAEFAAREKAEWECADLILCGSEFVRSGIAESGGPVRRCAVVPYGVDARTVAHGPKEPGRRLRVLIAGAVRLGKGAPYVLGPARTASALAQFRWCGGVALLPVAISQLSQHVDLRGAVPRPQMAEHYAWADVFLFPSVCEGSATVCYEALAAGLPVITTPNAGSVVRDGIDGFIVPIRGPEAIVEKLELLARDRGLLAWMSSQALARSGEFTLEKYGERLLGALRGLEPYRRWAGAAAAPDALAAPDSAK